MKTKLYRSLVTVAACRPHYTHSGRLPKPPTLFHGLAALACGLFLVATPTRAQYVTPSSYMNDLYIWWKNNAASPYNDVQNITVRATFLGGTAYPTQAAGEPSMAIFEGDVNKNYGGSVSSGLFGPVARGTGAFCNVTYYANPLSWKTNIPFMLYSIGTKLVLWMDLSSVWSNAKNLYFSFDKITLQNGWPWGNWIGLNGGVGSACGEVTLACSVYASAPR